MHGVMQFDNEPFPAIQSEGNSKVCEATIDKITADHIPEWDDIVAVDRKQCSYPVLEDKISDWDALKAANRRSKLPPILGDQVDQNEGTLSCSRSMSASQIRRLEGVLERYEVTVADVEQLAVLQDYKIVMICDDSSSMRNCSVPPQWQRIGDPAPSRWDELCCTVKLMIDISSCFASSGIDVHFLNRDPVLGVSQGDNPKLRRSFGRLPDGNTPLVAKLQQVCADFEEDRNVLLVVATDGLPSEGSESFSNFLKSAFSKEATKANLKMQIMACTDEDDTLAWLNEIDAQWSQVDVTDDYYSELQEVVRAGRVRRFRRSDWVVKSLLGPILPEFDLIDEKRKKKETLKRVTSGCCVVS